MSWNADPKKISDARKRAGLTQVELALKAGLHPATISLAERGICTAETAARIAHALGFGVSEAKRAFCGRRPLHGRGGRKAGRTTTGATPGDARPR